MTQELPQISQLLFRFIPTVWRLTNTSPTCVKQLFKLLLVPHV